ncbi:hypothetical protein RFI_35837, partial [Reticulomyxa filosa]
DCLYCLVWPEKLRMSVLIKVTQCFQELLLSPSKSRCNSSYLFAVVSSDEHNDLTRNLYCNSLSTFLTCNSKPKPFVQLYRSDIVGMGKTWIINRDIKELKKSSTKHVRHTCVRFNSSEIDWEWIIRDLWQHHPCQVDKDDIPRWNAKQEYVKYSEQDCIIVYHLD